LSAGGGGAENGGDGNGGSQVIADIAVIGRTNPKSLKHRGTEDAEGHRKLTTLMTLIQLIHTDQPRDLHGR
jgi:hypothetical protein